MKPAVQAPADNTLAGVHYHLEAYICGAGCVKQSPFEAWATFTLIMQQRPSGCRFAVARMVPVFACQPAGPWLCWDLHEDVETNRVSGLLCPPWPKWQGDSADALIMKAMALYDRD